MSTSKLILAVALLIALGIVPAECTLDQPDPSSIMRLLSVAVNITRAHCGLPLFLCCSSELRDFEKFLHERAQVNATRIIVPHELGNLTACMLYHQDIQIHPENAIKEDPVVFEPPKNEEKPKPDANGNGIGRFFRNIFDSVYNVFSTSPDNSNSNSNNRRKREIDPEYKSEPAQMLKLLIDIMFMLCPTSRFEYRPFYIENVCKDLDINTPLTGPEEAELHHLFRKTHQCKLGKLEMPPQCFAC
ncbi:unnamed protein product [Orchesella dallaii]|uniref:Uncharacterized protein n=1 Tax=Orchesella dallaii TaxID=48710 RepID=A0ABP1RPQ1_9HEXA